MVLVLSLPVTENTEKGKKRKENVQFLKRSSIRPECVKLKRLEGRNHNSSFGSCNQSEIPHQSYGSRLVILIQNLLCLSDNHVFQDPLYANYMFVAFSC